METFNVVIDEASTSKSSKATGQMSKSVIPLPLKNEQEVGDQDRPPPDSSSAIQALKDSSTSLLPEDQVEKEPSSRIKMNHPSDMIVGNMNELTLESKQLINMWLTLFLIHVICHR